MRSIPKLSFQLPSNECVALCGAFELNKVDLNLLNETSK